MQSLHTFQMLHSTSAKQNQQKNYVSSRTLVIFLQEFRVRKNKSQQKANHRIWVSENICVICDFSYNPWVKSRVTFVPFLVIYCISDCSWWWVKVQQNTHTHKLVTYYCFHLDRIFSFDIYRSQTWHLTHENTHRHFQPACGWWWRLIVM